MDITVYNMIFFLIGLLVCFTSVFCKGPECCSDIRDRGCRSLCRQVHAQNLPIPQMQMLLSDDQGCPPTMTDFWECMGTSLKAAQLMSSWPGKTCCELARGKECRRKCYAAEGKNEMKRYCREMDEPALFNCVRDQNDASICCNDAQTTSCKIVCRGVYLTGVSDAKRLLTDHCQGMDRGVAKCVQRHREPQHPVNHIDLPCCDRADTDLCRQTCRSVLQTAMSEHDRMDALIKNCSEPSPTEELWQCFLAKEAKKADKSVSMMRVDNAKLLCCEKASSDRCRNLCSKTYKKSWTYQSDFDSTCSDLQRISPVENERDMHNCLSDVDQPCKLGCSGLTFCRNFNDRPDELFRSCSKEADISAGRVFQSWMRGVIHLPHMDIPVKDIRLCKRSMWKAIACSLEIKPCTSQSNPINICREDCLTILNECVDSSRLQIGVTVAEVCNTLPSKSIPGACVSIEKYLYESSHVIQKNDVINPCQPNPCASDEICRIKRRHCKHPESCQSHICLKACPLGQPSNVWIPRGTKVILPDLSVQSNSRLEDCHVVCHCNGRGKLDNCKQLACVNRDRCSVGHGIVKDHGEQFWRDGSPSVCKSGVIIFARKKCIPVNSSPPFTALPGYCASEYEPVCGINGKTYPNPCLAHCDGISKFLAEMPCSEMDACSHKPCPAYHRCVPRPQVCLSTKSDGNCPQFECVSELGNCAPHHHDPACSSSGEEFSNTCVLFSRMRTLGYRGHCQRGCSNTGVVCGHDGETYSSECAAKAARVTVDYFGKCVAFGNLSESSLNVSLSCSQAICPPLQLNCDGITPPGGCCPICASHMTVLWDERQMKVAAQHMGSKIVSTSDILKRLSDQISVTQCDVYGYMGIAGELNIIVATSMPQPSGLQVKVCHAEARRLHNLINSGSPTLLSYLTLSPLVLSTLQQSSVPVDIPSNPAFVSDSYSIDKIGPGNIGVSTMLHFRTPWFVLRITIVLLVASFSRWVTKLDTL